MPLLEDRTASFIVRIWLEGAEVSGALGDWRGSIEHVHSGQRAFFRDLTAIVQFMKPHLAVLGIDTASRFWDLMSDDTPPEDHTARPPRQGSKRRTPPRS